MKAFIVELENGYRYKISRNSMRYLVYCIAPEDKVGYIEEVETNYYLEDGTKVYKAISYFTVKGAIYSMHEHAGLNVDYSACYNHYATCS